MTHGLTNIVARVPGVLAQIQPLNTHTCMEKTSSEPNELMWIECPLLVVLCIYCPIINCYKCIGLKQYTCIIVHVRSLGSGVWARFHWVLCFRVCHEAAVKMSARAGVSSKGLTEEGETDRLRAVGLKVSVPSWLLVIPCHVDLSNITSCSTKVDRKAT